MHKKANFRGVTFYRLLFSFFIIIFFCTFLITSQYIHFLNSQETQLEESYQQIADTSFENINSFFEQFETYCATFQSIRNLSDYDEIISASDCSNLNLDEFTYYFQHIYNAQMSGASNVSYLYLKNSDTILGLASSTPINKDEIFGTLGLSEKSWNTLLRASGKTCALFEKTDSMTYSRLMISKEVYADVYLIVGIAEENVSHAINASYLPENAQLTLATSNDQGLQVKTSDAYPKKSIRNISCSFENVLLPVEDSKKQYCFSKSLDDDILHAQLLIPDDFHDKKVHSVVLSLLLGFIIWILCGGGLSYVLTTKLYLPVEDLLKDLPLDSPLSHRSQEFRLVKNTVQNLEVQNQNYEKQIKQQNMLLISNLLSRILHGTLPLNDDLITLLQNSDFPVDLSSYVILKIIPMPLSEKNNPETEDSEEPSLTAIMQYILDLCQKETIAFYFIEDCESIVGIYSAEKTGFLDTLKQQTQNRFPLQLSIAVSQVHTILSEMPAAFEEVSQLTDFSVLMEDYDSIISWDSFSGLFASSPFNGNKDLETIRQFSSCLQYGQFGDARKLLSDIFEHFPAPSPENILESSRELTYLIDTLILSLEGEKYAPVISQLVINRQSLRKQSIRETQQFLMDLLETLQKQNEENSSSNQKIHQICIYIQEHYDDCSLSAQSIAEDFQISVPWLSTSFKKETGQGFLEYLHKYRIEKAKELISTTDLSLKDIAEKTGYTNYLTMSRAFKRYTGLTPKWFRS